MNLLNKHALAIVACSVCMTTAAQHTLSLADCRSMAIEGNKQIEVGRWQQQQAEARVKEYHANYLPSLDFTGTGVLSTLGGSRTTPDLQLPVFLGGNVTQPAGFAFIPSTTIDYNMHSLWQVGVSLTQPLYMGGKITAGYKMAQVAQQMAAVNSQKTADDVAVASDEAYMTAVKCLHLKKVATAYTAMVENLLKNVESACRVGKKTKNDLLRVQVALGECELAQARADNGYRLAMMNLCHVVGLPPDATIVLTDTIAPEVTMPPLSTDITERPEYALLQLNSDLATQKIKLARSEMMPSVGVRVDYGFLHGGSLMDEALIDKRLGLTAILSVKMPLFNWGKTTAKVRAAQAEYEATLATRNDMNERMVLEATQNSNRLQEAVLEVKIAERNLEQASENLRVNEKTFLAGTTTLNDRLEAGVLWLQASQRLIESRYNAYIASVRYRRSIGQSVY